MPSSQNTPYPFSRRAFLRGLRWTPVLFLPAPLQAIPWQEAAPEPFDFRITPVYPVKSPLEDVLRQVAPGSDRYVLEKYVSEIQPLLSAWGKALRSASPALPGLEKFAAAAIQASSLQTPTETSLRSGGALEVVRRRFANSKMTGSAQFIGQVKAYLAAFSRMETAEFEIVGIKESGNSLGVTIRYDLVGTRADKATEGRIGHWLTQWSKNHANSWQMDSLEAAGETVTRAHGPIFLDVTYQALGQTESFKNQMAHGADYWRTVLDGALGLDVYGNNGVAVGDIEHSGFDSFYVCQPAGLPNRLYRNRGDGTFEDVTESAGVGVLDNTACALFADFENKGLQDLLVVCGNGPLLFLNQGNGKFSLKRDAFKFSTPPQGTFTHAAIADYDNDGRLDVYFCLYSYYLGLDQYHYPAPYVDARNGPPNFLFHNEGNATFRDHTEAAGMNVDNDRYSFACAWGDSGSSGLPDLYVANDFGRSNLYKNNGNGTFTVVSREAAVDDPGAGMSACWLDFNNDGKQDIYVANMWSAAGIRVSAQTNFRPGDSEDLRSLYRQHARGNSLYANLGNGKFKNVSQEAGVEDGRWAWSSDSWDFDHDGFPDLYIANGYISGAGPSELSSFFWRQVVANSPATATPSLPYEQGWNAINELIRSGSSWSGPERNVLYANNHDGTFSEVSGVAGMDFPDDSRAFALADLDHDGRLEVILKNRNAPQLRVLRNAMNGIGGSIAFRLRGTKSNRDAIGAVITLATGKIKQTKYLQAGSGFLSQHSKEVFFGVGTSQGPVSATIRWPSGITQTFAQVPLNQRIEIEEGAAAFSATPFSKPPASYARAGALQRTETLPPAVETWLIDPLAAPDFSLPDQTGNRRTLQSFRGKPLLLSFCAASHKTHFRALNESQSNDLRIWAVLVENTSDSQASRYLPTQSVVVAKSTPEVVGIYNIIYRYLFDRRRDLGIPTSFLIDSEGMIVKVFQGPLDPKHLMQDAKSIPRTPAERAAKALPFPGALYQSVFQRNQFTYGVAMFQRGYLDQAAASFRQVIATKPEDPEAYYNLGTLELRRSKLAEAEANLEQTVKLKPNYPEAWNNLGMIAAQEGRNDEALRNFQQSLALRPGYVVGLLNLGNLQRRLGASAEAERALTRAVELEPENPEGNYALGMLYARQNDLDRATQLLEKSVHLRPDYSDALNNLGVLYVRQNNYSAAQEEFKSCIKVSPNFDQAYLNLARVYVLLNDKSRARDTLLELLRRQPEHKTAQQALEMLN